MSNCKSYSVDPLLSTWAIYHLTRYSIDKESYEVKIYLFSSIFHFESNVRTHLGSYFSFHIKSSDLQIPIPNVMLGITDVEY
jgi:hypothetical protein